MTFVVDVCPITVQFGCTAQDDVYVVVHYVSDTVYVRVRDMCPQTERLVAILYASTIHVSEKTPQTVHVNEETMFHKHWHGLDLHRAQLSSEHLRGVGYFALKL